MHITAQTLLCNVTLYNTESWMCTVLQVKNIDYAVIFLNCLFLLVEMHVC